MCGIYGVIQSEDSAAEDILSGLKTLEYRGYDSWGIAIKQDGKIAVDRHVGKIGDATTDLSKSTIGLSHTRWATHGGVSKENAHPHLDCTKTLAVVHNGIVENHSELRSALQKKNHAFVSETDTEVIAHLIEEEKKNTSFPTAVFTTFNKLDGSNAIAVLDVTSDTIVAARNGSPLVVGVGNNEYFIASDVTPFLHKTKKVIFLNDQEGVVITKNGVTVFDLTTNSEKPSDVVTVDWNVEDAEKGGYPHFLLKEIMDQKKTIALAVERNSDAIQKLAEKINAENYRVVFLGCGTAYYCALGAQYFFAEHGTNSHAYGGYEFAPFAKFYDERTVVIAISQSGETADTLLAVKEAKKNNAHIVAVVNARGSTLERIADITLPVSAGPEIAVVSTKAFTAQLAILYTLAYAVSGKIDEGKNNIHKLSIELEKWLGDNLTKNIITLVKAIVEKEDMYVIGKYSNYPAALEFALKIKETSYIHAEAFASGELKHGVITLVQHGTPCFVLASNDGVKQEILSSAAELKARGGYIIGIAPFTSPEFEHYIKTPDCGDTTIFGNIIVGQLLGYFLGIGRGTDPDKPRNLAKSVTVK